jgi:TonB family protein
MALRALLLSKNPETAESMSAILKEAGIRTELCVDIFAAMEKGTKQPFSCLIVDWSEQPEAGFLLKRAREAGLNRTAVAIAIVGDEPTPEEEREHRLDFLIYRPIVADEAQAVLAKACKQMQVHSPAYAGNAGATLEKPEILEPSEPTLEDPDLVSIASELPDSVSHAASEESSESTTFADRRESGSKSPLEFKSILAVGLVLIGAFFFWRSRDAFHYLATTPEGGLHVLKDSFAETFFVNKNGTQSVGTTMTDAQQDAYFARPAGNGNGQSASLGVASADIGFPDGPQRLRLPYDFPLPTPELHVDPVAPRPVRAAVPDSIKTSAPVARPVVVSVNPQMLPVSTSTPTSSPAWQQAGEPVRLTEESARALVLQSVNPVYPTEAIAQKLQGPVVLQVAIGRDGTVRELKLVRGYFVLAKAAIAAVKQWRFRPYNVNGRALETQTVITINFSYPPG